MVCILKPYGEIIAESYEIKHTDIKFKLLVQTILEFKENTRVVIEATGTYHFPLLSYLKTHNIFVSVINPLVMKRYSFVGLRKGKTNKMDAVKIYNYGIYNWFRLIDYKVSDEIYSELKLLGIQYFNSITMRV